MNKFILIVLIFILSGCAGTSFNFDDVRKVKVGDSREILVEKMRGEPYMVNATLTAEGTQEIYVYTYVGFGYSTKTASFILIDGIVTSAPYVPTGFK